MATFLNTSGTSFYLEKLIKDASERVILISPFLKLNDRIKELLEDKDRLKIDIRIVYGKAELQPAEINWLKELKFIRTSFCKNLHAKCYLSEDSCIITSLNLYEFSQVNNNEMGVLIDKYGDPDMYKDAYEEAQRIIRISDEVRISLETIAPETIKSKKPTEKINPNSTNKATNSTSEKLSTSKLAKKLGITTKELSDKLVANGYLEINGEDQAPTAKGSEIGAEKKKGRFGDYILWPDSLSL